MRINNMANTAKNTTTTERSFVVSCRFARAITSTISDQAKNIRSIILFIILNLFSKNITGTHIKNTNGTIPYTVAAKVLAYLFLKDHKYFPIPW